MVNTPKPKFVMIGRGKFVHVIHTEAYDRKNAQCQVIRKAVVAGKIDYKKDKGLSAEAALALDGCTACGTEVVATSLISPDSKRAERADKRDDTLKRASGKKESLTEKTRKARKTVTKEEKPAKKAVVKVAKAPSKTKAGTRSTGSDTDSKAKALAMFMADNGWDTDITTDKATGHTVVNGLNGEQSIRAYFIDGKYDVSRHATINVGGWSGTLRGAHAVRRQVAKDLEDRDRPHPKPGAGRSGPRKSKADEPEVPEDESPEDAKRRVPFAIDAPDIEIIDAIKGKTVKWRNATSNTVQEAVVPSTVNGAGTKKAKHALIKITNHPTKPGRRILSFYGVEGMGEHGEVYGGERNVALDKIIRVVG